MLISSPPCGPVIQQPQLAGLRIQSQPLRILESVRPGFGQDRRAAEPGIVARNRSVTIDMHHASREVPAFVGVIEEGMLHAVEFRLVEPEAVGARNKEAAIGSHDYPPLADSFTNHVDTLETF